MCIRDSCISDITYLDGENGILRYRGYSVDELCEKKSFLDVVYLLIFGDLPTENQLTKFQDDIREEALVDEDLKRIFKSFPRSAHPIDEPESVSTSSANPRSPAAPSTEGIVIEKKRIATVRMHLDQLRMDIEGIPRL